MKRSLLAPLVPLYAAGAALRGLALQTGLEAVRRLDWPVISIGNLSTGGSGKTPMTIALAKMLASRGMDVDVLSRGYGRVSAGVARVDPQGSAEQYGDEPLLIARKTGLAVYVARQRYRAGQLAEKQAFGLDPGRSDRRAHLLDDGFQHRQLHRDVDLVLLNSGDLDDRLLPAGDLREGCRALRRASILAVPDGDERMEARLRTLGLEQPIWRLRRIMDIPPDAVDGKNRILAFCGIARPEQFFAGLQAGGVPVAARLVFADHHHYTKADINRLIDTARISGATAWITTAKDRVRMGSLAEQIPANQVLHTASLRVAVVDEEDGLATLMRLLERE